MTLIFHCQRINIASHFARYSLYNRLAMNNVPIATSSMTTDHSVNTVADMSVFRRILSLNARLRSGSNDRKAP
jgi:hypothetical protein